MGKALEKLSSALKTIGGMPKSLSRDVGAILGKMRNENYNNKKRDEALVKLLPLSKVKS